MTQNADSVYLRRGLMKVATKVASCGLALLGLGALGYGIGLAVIYFQLDAALHDSQLTLGQFQPWTYVVMVGLLAASMTSSLALLIVFGTIKAYQRLLRLGGKDRQQPTKCKAIKMMRKPPYMVFLALPGSPVVLYLYATAHNVPSGALANISIALSLIGWGGAAWLWFDHRKVVSNRLVIEVRPSELKLEDGTVYHQPFSSSSRFLNNSKAFERALDSVASRPSKSKGRFMYPAESALLRLWPGDKGISEVEYHRLLEVAASVFIDPVIEVSNDTANISTTNRFF